MSARSDYTYSKLEDDSLRVMQRPVKAAGMFSLATTALFLVAALFGSGTTLLAAKYFQPSQMVEAIPKPFNELALNPDPAVPELSCGNSTAEAIAAGCTFDRLTFAWLHPECPRDFEQEHLDHNNGEPWEYWLDKEATQLLPQDDNYETISFLDTYYSRNSEHLTHCVFIILRFYKVVNRGGQRIDVMSKHYAHAHHCLMFLLRLAETNPEFYQIATLGTVGYLGC